MLEVWSRLYNAYTHCLILGIFLAQSGHKRLQAKTPRFILARALPLGQWFEDLLAA